jgi:acetyltransferase
MNVMDERSRFRDLTQLLRPKTVAVIGASEQPGNLGGIAVNLMLKFGFRGQVWPVNPKRTTVHGLPCFPTVADLPAPADLAIIATGAELAITIVRDCAAAGLRNGIIWAGGYAEVGEEGAAMQEALLTACRETGFTLVGPNCLGIIDASNAMVATFASFLIESDVLIPGNIAMISQSGGLATMAQAMAQRKGMGFSLTVSTGNEAMLTVADYIQAVASDEATKIVAAYVEGVRDGPRFIEAVSAARAAGKPVVILKGGLTATSALAAAAHTGALAGERRVWEAMARELGIITVGSLEELLDVALSLSRMDLTRMPKGNGIAVVSFGGGSGVLSADQCAEHGLVVPSLSPETRARLRPLLTPIASTQNPIDLTPQTFNSEKWFATFPEALDVIASDPNIDIVFCQFGPQAQRGVETAKIIADLRHRTGKTVCIAWPLAPKGAPEMLESEGVYVFQEYERAISALAKLARNVKAAERTAKRRTGFAAFDWDAHIPAPVKGMVISENECHAILAQAGIATARGHLAVNETDAIAAAARLGYPLAAKGISAQVTHRAAAGLVALNIRTEDDLVAAFRTLTDRARTAGVTLDGIYLQEMISKGLEVIVSAFCDPIFGTMVSCGSGGNLTEIIEDVTIARTPLDREGARHMLEDLRIVAAAGKLDPQAKLDDLASFVADFSEIAHSAPWENFVIEINPVKWSGAGVTAIDGLILIEKP